MSTVSAIPAPTAVYREEQLFAWWIYAAVAGAMAVTGLYLAYRPHDGRGLLSFIPGLFLIGMPLHTLAYLRMTTQVTAGTVEVWFGWIPSYRRTIDVASIVRVEPVTYSPLKHCGGWGIHASRDGERVLNARGDRGVRLHFADGSRLLIGSQHPEALAGAIERAIHPV